MSDKPDFDFPAVLTEAFSCGLRQKFGEVIGVLLTDVAAYYPRTYLDPERLQRLVKDDGTAALRAIVANRLDESTMRLIRSQMIGAALTADRSAVARWATEGLNRSAKVGGAWAATQAQWTWALQNTDRYILYARRLKHFLNQL